MHKHKIKITIFFIVGIIQLFTVFSMIHSHEKVLKNGTQYKMKTEAVDPYDPFRGRYIRLAVNNRLLYLPKNNNYKEGQIVYALLKVDKDGFVQIKSISRKKPNHNNYIKTKIIRLIYVWRESKRIYKLKNISLDLPFKRYYIEEGLAPKAEEAYMKQNRKDKQSAHITFRVLKGKAILEELYIKNIPIKDYLSIMP